MIRLAFAAGLSLLITAAASLGPVAQAGDRRYPHAAGADHRLDEGAARAALARKEILPLPRILAIAARRLPGDVLRVELEHHNNRFTYELGVLGKDGRVSYIELDAGTGAVLRLVRY